jgi:hypothetical protein
VLGMPQLRDDDGVLRVGLDEVLLVLLLALAAGAWTAFAYELGRRSAEGEWRDGR